MHSSTATLEALVSLLILCACQPNQTGIPPSTSTETMGQTATAEAPTPEVETTSPAGTGASIANCSIFPADNIWNASVDLLPVHSMSDAWIDHIGREEDFHMDFGSGEWDGGPIGIPYNVVAGSTVQNVTFEFYYPDESDAGPYPLPLILSWNMAPIIISWWWMPIPARCTRCMMQVWTTQDGVLVQVRSGT